MCNIIIFAFNYHCTNIESYGHRLLVKTISGILHTSPVVTPMYWNLASIGRSLCMHNGLSKVCSSMVEQALLCSIELGSIKCNLETAKIRIKNVATTVAKLPKLEFAHL